MDIVPTTKGDPGKPKFGALTGTVTALDPDWWKPMIGDEVVAFLDRCCRLRLILRPPIIAQALAGNVRGGHRGPFGV